MADEESKGGFNKWLSSGVGGLVTGGTSGIMDLGIGLITENQRETRQANRQKEFMEIQNRNQRGLNQQGHDLQMDMWNKTNYGAQMEHIKEAGLNPAMLYGKGGAGGATTGSQGGGTASGGVAPSMKGMDVRMGAQAQQGAIQGALAESTIEVNKASANKLNADAEKIRGWEKDSTITGIEKANAEIDKLKQETGTEIEKTWLISVQRKLAEAQTANEGLKGGNITAQTENYQAQTRNADEMLKQMKIQTGINEATKESAMMIVGNSAVQSALNIALTNSKISLTDEQRSVAEHSIYQNWVKVGFSGLGDLVGNWIKLKGKKTMTQSSTKGNNGKWSEGMTQTWQR